MFSVSRFGEVGGQSENTADCSVLIVGDKSNHVPAFHVPQLYYFVGFATAFGWPALVSGKGGIVPLAHDVYARMFGSKRY